LPKKVDGSRSLDKRYPEAYYLYPISKGGDQWGWLKFIHNTKKKEQPLERGIKNEESRGTNINTWGRGSLAPREQNQTAKDYEKVHTTGRKPILQENKRK